MPDPPDDDDRKRRRLETLQRLKRNRLYIDQMLEVAEEAKNDEKNPLVPRDTGRLERATERLRRTYAVEGSSADEALDNRFDSDTAIADIWSIISGSESAREFFKRKHNKEQPKVAQEAHSAKAAKRRLERETAIRDVATKNGVPLKKGDQHLGYFLVSKVNEEFARLGIAGKKPLTPRALRDIVARMSPPRKRKPKPEPK
jgi:hypothetical protein